MNALGERAAELVGTFSAAGSSRISRERERTTKLREEKKASSVTSSKRHCRSDDESRPRYPTISGGTFRRPRREGGAREAAGRGAKQAGLAAMGKTTRGRHDRVPKASEHVHGGERGLPFSVSCGRGVSVGDRVLFFWCERIDPSGLQLGKDRRTRTGRSYPSTAHGQSTQPTPVGEYHSRDRRVAELREALVEEGRRRRQLYEERKWAAQSELRRVLAERAAIGEKEGTLRLLLKVGLVLLDSLFRFAPCVHMYTSDTRKAGHKTPGSREIYKCTYKSRPTGAVV